MKSVYYYDNEGYFTVTEPAYLNVEETKKQGKDVYYCPESATLIEPPEIGENEILHFDGVKWNIVKNYKWQYEINENMELKAIDHYGEPDEGYYLITKEEYNKIIQDRDYYILENGKLVENPDYEEIKAKRLNQTHIETIKQELIGLDAQAIRPLRAILAGTNSDEDIEKLKAIENQVSVLREELSTLQ